jgi:hypothetical protein
MPYSVLSRRATPTLSSLTPRSTLSDIPTPRRKRRFAWCSCQLHHSGLRVVANGAAAGMLAVVSQRRDWCTATRNEELWLRYGCMCGVSRLAELKMESRHSPVEESAVKELTDFLISVCLLISFCCTLRTSARSLYFTRIANSACQRIHSNPST